MTSPKAQVYVRFVRRLAFLQRESTSQETSPCLPISTIWCENMRATLIQSIACMEIVTSALQNGFGDEELSGEESASNMIKYQNWFRQNKKFQKVLLTTDYED